MVFSGSYANEYKIGQLNFYVNKWINFSFNISITTRKYLYTTITYTQVYQRGILNNIGHIWSDVYFVVKRILILLEEPLLLNLYKQNYIYFKF